MIAAIKGTQKIAVEIKSFVGPSKVNEFHKAMGQFNDYFVALESLAPDRELFLAVPESIYKSFFQEDFIQRALKRNEAQLVIFDPHQELIKKWIK